MESSRSILLNLIDNLRRNEFSQEEFVSNMRLMQKIDMLERIGFADQKVDNIMVTSNQLEEVKETTIAIKFIELSKMHLKDLPSLRSLSAGDDIIDLPLLEDVVVNHCPNVKKFGLGKIERSQLKSVIVDNQLHGIDIKIAHLFETPDVFSTVTEYNIGDNEELGKALNNLQPSDFTNLLLFRAQNCDRRLIKFLSILVKRSTKLEAISIEQCNTVEYLFEVHDLIRDDAKLHGDGKYLTRLKELKLTKLSLLERIWSIDPTGTFGLKNLQMIHIKSCPSLEYLIVSPGAEKLHQLNELKLEACEKLKKIVYTCPTKTTEIKFPALSKVELKSLKRLKCFYGSHLEFPSLKILMIEKCPVLKEFTTGFATSYSTHTTDGKSFFELNELKLDSCDRLIVVMSSETLQELGNLKKLSVSHCNGLERIFEIRGEISHSTELLQQLDELILINLPNLTSIINRKIVKFCQNLQILQVKQCESLTSLPGPLMLTNMEISDCKALEKIMIIDKEEGTRGKVTFSQLQNVSLENLTNLSVVFPSTSEFPSLEKLKIKDCPALMTFVEESNEDKDLPESATSNYFFPNSMSLDKLKVLYVINQHVEKLWHYSCPSKSFCELEILTLSNNNRLLSFISSSMIIRFNNLKKLTLDRCKLLTEVFNLKDDGAYHNIQEVLPKLRALALSNLRGLTSVWNMEPQVPFFSNLVSLFIVNCDNLKSLFSATSSKNFRKLKLLKLCNCEKIKDVISDDKDENVIFPEMECLVLKDLPKLVSFYRHSGSFDWPNLQTLRISNIPSMETFSGGDLNTPLLSSVYITFAKKLWLGNLNKTVSHMHKHNNPDSDDVDDDYIASKSYESSFRYDDEDGDGDIYTY